MRIQDHLAKLSWTAADKLLFVVYGFVQLVQIRSLTPVEFGLFALLNALQTFISTVSDSAILQAIVMRGSFREECGAVNRFALTWHLALTLGASVLVWAASVPLSQLLGEPRVATVAGYVPLMCLVAIPRTFCIKLLSRDVQAKAIFTVNAAWIGSMVALTAWMIATQRLQHVDDMVFIAASGMAVASCAALWITRKLLVFAVEKQVRYREVLFVGLYQGLAGIIGNGVRQLDIYIVQYFFGTATVGMYQSAKSLFRFFDEAFSGVMNLLYPGTIRLVAERREEELLAFISKTLSFTLMTMIAAVLFFWFGGAELLVRVLLPAKFSAAMGYFLLLVLVAPLLPFEMLKTVVIAYGAMRELLLYIVLGGLAGIGTTALVGVLGAEHLVPLGVVAYNAVFGGLCFFFMRSRLNFPLHLLWRAIPDTRNFLQPRL